MKRPPVVIRPAESADAPRLVEIWRDVIRRGEVSDQARDMEEVVSTAASSVEQRVLVAEAEGEVVGAVHLRVATMTPINLEPTVQVMSPHVLAGHRRKGIGMMLMQQAVVFAEEVGVGHITTAAVASSREANRFMARLALGPLATVRVSSTAALRTRLESRLTGKSVGRQRSKVLAARRSARRHQQLSE